MFQITRFFPGFSKKRLNSRLPRRRYQRPCEALQALWNNIQSEHFPELTTLREFTVGWSTRRQRRTLASVEVRRKYVRVAKELNDPLFAWVLEPLLYHEMCHAVLGEDVGYHKGKRAWHGPKFRELEGKHPETARLDEWIKAGGWRSAVRRSRAVEYHAANKKRKQQLAQGWNN